MKTFLQLAVILLLLSSSVATMAQSKFCSRTSTNPYYAFSASTDKYMFYSVSAGNTDGGFRYTAIIREDKKTKARAVFYRGEGIDHLMACGDWVYYKEFKDGDYIRRVKVDGSGHQLLKIGSSPFIYKNRLYFSEFNALRFYDLQTMDIHTASTQITSLTLVCNDVGILFDDQNEAYTLARMDPQSGVITSVERFRLNGLQAYFSDRTMMNDGYVYYSGMIDSSDFKSLDNVLYRTKLGDNNAQAELVACLPTTRTGSSIDMGSFVGAMMDNDCLYIGYRGQQSPNNGEIWRYSLDGKVKKRITILLTDALSKTDDWIYTMGQWTWEQRRTNVKTGKQELLFQGKADNLSALNTLGGLEFGSQPTVHPKSLPELAKPDVTLCPNSPYILVDRQHKYNPQGYSLTRNENDTKYYRVADVAEMLSKTNKSFNYVLINRTMKLSPGTYIPSEKLKIRGGGVQLPAMRRTGELSKGGIRKSVTYYEADGEQFYLFRDILGILKVNVEGNNVTTTTGWH